MELAEESQMVFYVAVPASRNQAAPGPKQTQGRSRRIGNNTRVLLLPPLRSFIPGNRRSAALRGSLQLVAAYRCSAAERSRDSPSVLRNRGSRESRSKGEEFRPRFTVAGIVLLFAAEGLYFFWRPLAFSGVRFRFVTERGGLNDGGSARKPGLIEFRWRYSVSAGNQFFVAE